MCADAAIQIATAGLGRFAAPLAERAIVAADIGLSGLGIRQLTGTVINAGGTRVINVAHIIAEHPGAIPAGEIRGGRSPAVC